MKNNKLNQKKYITTLLLAILIVFSIIQGRETILINSLQDDFITNINNTESVWQITEVVTTETTDGAGDCSLAVDDFGNIHVAWRDMTDYAGAGTDYDIFYKFWNATSLSWNMTEVVSIDSTNVVVEPSLAVDSVGNVYIAWQDYTNHLGAGSDLDIFYKFWNATSKSWNGTEVISIDSTAESSVCSLTVDLMGNVHIAWLEATDMLGSGTDMDIFYKFWNATSLSWNDTSVVSTESSANSRYPSIAVDDFSNVHIAWEDATNYGGSGADYDIFYKFWNASSLSWNSTEVVSTTSSLLSRIPSLDVDSAGNVYITWWDQTGNDIYFRSWFVENASWSTSQVVSSESTGTAQDPSLKVDGEQNIHIAWEDHTDYAGSGTDIDIFYKFWNATTLSWNITEVVSTVSSEICVEPSLDVDDLGDVHIAWEDWTDYSGSGTDADIFYRKLIVSPSYPVLEDILPNPSVTGNITLNWKGVLNTDNYYVFRSQSSIISYEGLIPIATLDSSTTTYEDLLLPNGTYYYIVVSSNYYFNRSSNEVWVVVSIPPVINEFNTQSLIFVLGSAMILSVFLIFKRRKKRY